MPTGSFRQNGFTLIEAIAVIVITGIVLLAYNKQKPAGA